MAEQINLKLTAESLNVTGLTIQGGRLELSLTAEVDLSALECDLRAKLLVLAERAADTGPAVIPAGTLQEEAVDSPALTEPLPLPALTGLLDAPETAVLLPVDESVPPEEFATSGQPELIPEERVEGEKLAGGADEPVPQEHFFPDPDDENLLAEEALAGYSEEEFFPEPRETDDATTGSAAETGVLFEAKLPPSHYFPEPGEELLTEGVSTGGSDESDEWEEPEEDAEELENLQHLDGLTVGLEEGSLRDDAAEKPAVARADMTPAAVEEESPEEEYRAGWGEEPDEEQSRHSDGRDAGSPEAAAAELPRGQTLEEGLSAPAARYGEPVADIEWSALLGDRHSETASSTQPVDTRVESHRPFSPEELVTNTADREDAVEEPSPKGFAAEQEPAAKQPEDPVAEECSTPAPETHSAPANANRMPGAAAKTRLPFELINPKLHNAGDAPDDTPPGDGGALQPAQNAAALPHEQRPAPLLGSKPKIKYVCPKCHTPGQQEMDRLGSVVTCANCGRAMRLTMRR